ncbi:MAG: sensor histidine kinase [Anaerolineales bacterium]
MSLKVLIADDEALVSEMLQATVERLGHTVVGDAANGEEAIRLTAERQPDVVLMDIDMPGMDGVTAAKRIQEECPTPVIVVTAFDTPELVRKASDAGVVAYLVKPPNPRELERTLMLAVDRFADMQALQRLNNELSTYDHTVAHDLKKPLAILVPSAELLAEEYETLKPQEIQNRARSIAQAARKMDNIINSLLLLTETSQKDAPLEPLDMPKIIQEARSYLETRLTHRHVRIHAPDSWPPTLGYAPWVEAVWANYLSNALKYGCPNGGQLARIDIGAERDPQTPNMVRYWVRDYGPGLTTEEQARLFTPFERLTQTDIAGHGLGLSIVQRIVNKLGGEVGVESVPGAGSTFWFTLPAANGE